MERQKMKVQESGSATIVMAKAKQMTKGNGTTAPIRVKQKTRDKMDDLLRRANKNKLGRKVKTDDLIFFSLELVTDEHLSRICDKTLTNKDRLEILFRKASKDRKGLTRDEFFGLLLDGKVGI